MNRTNTALVALAVLLASAAPSTTAGTAQFARSSTSEPIAPQTDQRPRLTVVISIDQFRGDYLARYEDLFLPATDGDTLGGFSYLMDQGAYFADARYDHYPLFTGPGHAVILTGGHPSKTGIVGNDWWDVVHRRPVYCVDDPRWAVVGAAPESKASPMGPLNLYSSTVGDELKLATAGRAKVVTLAIKDRAAILLGGHAQDVSLWFDTAGGRWISSTAYCRDGELPAWVQQLNEERIPSSYLGKPWTPRTTEQLLRERSMVPTHVGGDIPEGFGRSFPHTIGAEDKSSSYKGFCLTPFANDFVFESAERAVQAEGLGQRNVPDLLAINLSPNDYIGHAFGPYSPEVMEMTLATDRALSGFINFLNETVPGGMDNVLFVVTADHGVAPIPEETQPQPTDFTVGRYESNTIIETIDRALRSRFGVPAGGCWFATTTDDPTGEALANSGAFIDGQVYLSPEAIRGAVDSGRADSRRDIERVACDSIHDARLPWVYACYGRTQIIEGAIGQTDLTRHLANGVHPTLSGDLIIIGQQASLEDPPSSGHPTTHGTPYAYDTHVPILISSPRLVRAGTYANRVAPSDIAPTISLLLGVEFPSACDGRVLHEALLAHRPREPF